MNFRLLLICSVIFITVMGAPMPTGDDSEIRGEVETPPPTRWQGAWETAKGFFSKLSSYVGADDAGTLLQRIGQATTFYNMLRENPQQLVDNLKRALNNAVSQALLNNPAKARELQSESMVVQKQIQNAAAAVNDENQVQVRTMVPDARRK